MSEKAKYLQVIDEKANIITDVSDKIWEYAELSLMEFKSCELYVKVLKEQGFNVECPVCGIDTAFKATYGSGKPVIGILAEYDALSGLSQEANSTVRKELVRGGSGHGCGHNLLGVGAAAAAIALKDLIAQGKASGTVVFLGCPAEETGSAKAFLARDGHFDGINAMLTWHPWDYNGIWPGGSLANVKLIFRFKGRSAHAASSPHLGRSALDALELMNVGVQFLREHVPDDTRIHYAITDAGGDSPNVVQGHAEAVYLVRSQRLQDLEEIKNRVIDCARGAAIMTGTQMDMEFVKGCSNLLPNVALEEALIDSMKEIGVPSYTEEELALAASLHDALQAPETTLEKLARLCTSADREALLAHQGEGLYTFIAPHTPTDAPIFPVSTDVGDASWCAPTSQVACAAWAADTPAHSWQAVSIGRSSIAHKAMLLAAKTIALTGARLMTDESLLARAKAEHQRRTAKTPYRCPVPEGLMPKY